MEWLYKVVICVCTAGVIAALFSGISHESGIFRCVKLIISLTLCVFIINTLTNTSIDVLFPDLNLSVENENNTYSTGVLNSFVSELENNIEYDVNQKYNEAEADVYVVAQINDKYVIEIIRVSVGIKEGDIYEIINMISNNYNIEKEKIYVQKE